MSKKNQLKNTTPKKVEVFIFSASDHILLIPVFTIANCHVYYFWRKLLKCILYNQQKHLVCKNLLLLSHAWTKNLPTSKRSLTHDKWPSIAAQNKGVLPSQSSSFSFLLTLLWHNKSSSLSSSPHAAASCNADIAALVVWDEDCVLQCEIQQYSAINLKKYHITGINYQ